MKRITNKEKKTAKITYWLNAYQTVNQRHMKPKTSRKEKKTKKKKKDDKIKKTYLLNAHNTAHDT